MKLGTLMAKEPWLEMWRRNKRLNISMTVQQQLETSLNGFIIIWRIIKWCFYHKTSNPEIPYVTARVKAAATKLQEGFFLHSNSKLKPSPSSSVFDAELRSVCQLMMDIKQQSTCESCLNWNDKTAQLCLLCNRKWRKR